MQYIPHDYQAYCIQRVVENPAVGLFLRPGLGKTSITLSAINILKYFRWQVSRVLVVAPKKVAEATWQKEAARWDHTQHLRISTVLGSASKRIQALNTPADVYVVNRENVEWLVDYYRQAWPFDMVVLDESTSFKNPRSKRFKALGRVRRFIKRMVLLTGTPSSKGLIDLWAQVYLLDGGERLGATLGAYRERYFDPDQRSRTQIFSYRAKEGAEGAVLAAISDICITMKGEDYLQLPDFVQHEVPVILEGRAKRNYDRFERELLLEVDEDIITAAPPGCWWGSFCSIATERSTTATAGRFRSTTASWRPSASCWSSWRGSIASSSMATSTTGTASWSSWRSRTGAAGTSCGRGFTGARRTRRPGTAGKWMCCWRTRPAAPTVLTSRRGAAMWCGTASTGALSSTTRGTAAFTARVPRTTRSLSITWWSRAARTRRLWPSSGSGQTPMRR